jgi:TP901 family phage tail tape measure protein
MEMQEHQRVAAKAAGRVGEFQVVQQAGQLLVNDKLVGQAKDAINVFATFDDKMAGVAAITTATGDSLDALREKAKYLGATTRFTASEAADAMSFLGMAGFKTEAILSGTQSTLDLASAGQLGLAESADIASNVLSGMQLKVEDLGHVTDVMARTATSANTNIQQMGVAMSYAAPNAALFGATLEETSALIGVMSNAGVQADKAGTATRGAFLKLASPVKEGKIALAEMGMTLVDSSGNMRNVIEIFNELNDKLKISPDTLKSIQDAGEDIDSLGEVSQSKQIQALKGIFGTTGISGASAALGQIKELNRLAIATRASSTNTEQLTQYFTELRDIKMKPGQDLFAAIIEQTPSYTEAVRQIDEANLALMQVNLKTLNSLDSSRLTDYFQQVKGISTAPGQSLFAAVVENAPDTQSALNQVSTAMEQLGIQVKGQVGAARLMAQVMENNLAGSFRSLESALEAVQVNFIEPLTPLIRLAIDAATQFALFLANLPAPIRTTISVAAALTLGMGALAIAIGAAGVTLFGFQQAMAVTNLASSSLAAGLIPLTGFFDTAQKAIVATNPLETFFKRNTQLAGDFEKAAAGTFDETIAGMKLLGRQAIQTGKAFLVMSRSLMLSPIGLGIGGFLLLNTVLEQVVPGFNLLGTVLGAIAAPFGFIYGLLKGIIHSFLDLLGLTGSGAMGTIAPVFGTITNAIELAAKSFSLFAESGERIGERLGKAITLPFELAGQAISSSWDRTISFIRGILRPFADFVQGIGQMLIGFLAEASPGPTFWIRKKWAMTVQFLQGLFERLKVGAAAVGQQLLNAFTTVLPQLSSAISIATVFAELSGIINPVQGLAIAIGNTIFGGIVESMGKSLDEVIPIFIRRFSLVAAFGGFLAQRLNFLQPLQAQIIAGLAIITGLSTFYLKTFSFDIASIWHTTVQIIQGDLQALAGVAKNVGLLLISFLAEASPGPTYWIRRKWAMTIEFLSSLFKKIRSAAVLVNQAFLGIGDVSSDQGIVARQQILEGVVLSLVSGVKLLGSVATGVDWAITQINQSVASAIDNLDLLGFTLLTLSSLPMTLIGQLAQGFEAVLPELALFVGVGLPRAIAYALPGAVAIAMSTGLIQGLEKGFATFVAGMTERSKVASQQLSQMFDANLKQAINRGLSEGVTTFVRNLPSVFPGMEDYQFTFDFDQAYADYESQREARVQAITAYLQEVGVVANQVGQQLQAALAPLLSFRIGDIFPALSFLPPLIPLVTAIVPAFQSLSQVVQSPAVQGIVNFLTGTVLPTALQTLRAIASTVGLVFNAFISLPLTAALIVITRPIVSAYRELLAFLPQIPGILGRAIVQLARTAATAVANLLARIPYIGETVSRAFLGTVEFLIAVTPVYFRLLRGLFERYFLKTIRPLLTRFQQLFGQVAQGIVYALERGFKPLGTLLFRALNPMSAFKLIGTYIRTKGFAGLFKPGLFMLNPFDLFFGGIPGISWAVRTAATAFYRIPFPAGIIDKKSRELFQIFAGSEAFLEAELKSRRLGRTMLVSIEDILKTQPAIGRFLIQILRGVLMINPLVQIIGRIALTTMFWYSVLKPITPEMFEAIAATKMLGLSLSPVASILKGMRFVFVDMNEAFMRFARGIIPFMRGVQNFFNVLGTITGVVVHETAGITSILLNLFKATFGNLGLLVAIGFAGAIDAALIGFRALAQLARLKTEQYGDALVALFQGNIGPLLGQITSDVMGVVGFIFEQTIVRVTKAALSLASTVGGAIRATFQEIVRFIRDPWNESIRLLNLLDAAVDRVLGNIARTINVYIQQLQLDRLARFLSHYWVQLAAIADVLLAVYGVLNPMQAVISGLIGLGLFLIQEYRTGFQTLDALIQGLAHPIELITNAIKAMVAALGIYIPPDLTNLISNVTEQFIKSLPIITGGVFLIALLIKRNIGEAFSTVTGGVMKIVGGLMQAIDATRVFGSAISDVAQSPKVQAKVGSQVHKVRRQESVLGVRNPFAYSQNEDQQRRAAALGDERVSKSRAALRYQDEINKSLQKIVKEEEEEIKRLARSRNARDQIMAFGGKLQRPDGFSYEVAPLLEKKKGLLGLNRLELSETGKATVADQARRRITSPDSESAMDTRMQAAKRSGLTAAFERHSGSPPPDDVLRILAKQGDYGITNLMGAFQKAMQNLHVQDFQVNKLYVAEFNRPQNFPTQTPIDSNAFDIQLNRFRSNPIHANKEIIKKAKTASEIQIEIDQATTTGDTGYANLIGKFKQRLEKMFEVPAGNSAIVSSNVIEEHAKTLSAKFNLSEEEYQKARKAVITDLLQRQAKSIGKTVTDFNDFEEANIEALKQANRRVEGFHPIATNTDVLAQAVRNIAGQTQAEVDQLNQTRRSFFSSLFGFTGVPQLIENFQYNRRLFRRSQQISRRVEEMARQESKDKASAQAARQRGLEALMSRSGSGYDFHTQSAQFYASKQINAQEQAFIESWVKNRSFKVDITQHQAFRPEVDKIIDRFKQLSTNLTLNTVDDVKKFRQTLNDVSTQIQTQLSKDEQTALKKLEQYLLHGASEAPKGGQLSFGERDSILAAINKSIANNKGAFGITGDHKDISKASFKKLYDQNEVAINRIISQFAATGEFVAKIGGKNEYIEGAYKEIERKLGLGGGGKGSSLRRIQDIKFSNTIRQLGINFGLFVQSIEENVAEFRERIYRGLDSFEGWLESHLRFPSLAAGIVDLIRRPFEFLSNNIEAIYTAQKINIQNMANQIRADFVGSNVVSRINNLNQKYKEAREASLQTILQSSRDERIAKLGRKNAFQGAQLGPVWEELKKRQLSQAQSGQTVSALMRGGMSEQAVRAMLDRELRRQGMSRDQVTTEIDKVLASLGNQAHYSVGDILKMRGIDATKVSKALESALSLEAKAVEQILKNPNYTARAVGPFQLFMIRDIVGILGDTFRGIGGTMVRLVRPVAKDVTAAFGSNVLTRIANVTREINKFLEIGASRLEVGIIKIVGRNPLSRAINRFASSLGGQTDLLARFFDKQAGIVADQAPKTFTVRIVNAVQSIYKAVSDNLTKAYNYVQAQKGILPAIARLMGGVRDFFKGLFRNKELEKVQQQISQQRRAFESNDPRKFKGEEQQARAASRRRRIAEQLPALEEKRRLLARNPVQKVADYVSSKKLPERGFNRIGQTFEGMSSRLSEFATVLRDKRVKAEEKRRGGVYDPDLYDRVSPRGQRRGASGLGQTMSPQNNDQMGGVRPREGMRYIGRGIVGATQDILPLTTKIFSDLLSAGAKTSDRLGQFFRGAALKVQGAWWQSATDIMGRSWRAMVTAAKGVGSFIIARLNHGSADVTAAAWDRTQHSVSQDMQQMAETAQATGRQISGSMERSATRSVGFFSQLGNSIGRVGKAGMAIGGAVTGIGFGAQTAVYSLSTMGFVSEDTSEKLRKFFEIFTLFGAVGGIVTPLFAAVASSLGAIGAIAGTVGTAIVGVGGAIASVVGLGSVAFAPIILGIAAVGLAFAGLYLAIKSNFLGIGNILTTPIHWIEAAWQGFVDRFGARLMPIIQPALNVAQGLINALNHNPTLRIPEAWEAMKERIGAVFNWMSSTAGAIGNAIVGFFSPIGKLFSHGGVREQPAIQPRENSIQQLEHKVQQSTSVVTERASGLGRAVNDLAAKTLVDILAKITLLVGGIVLFRQQVEKNIANLGAQVISHRSMPSSLIDAIGIGILAKTFAASLGITRIVRGVTSLGKISEDLLKPIQKLASNIGLKANTTGRRPQTALELTSGTLKGLGKLGDKLRPIAGYIPAIALVAPDVAMLGSGLIGLSYAFSEFPVFLLKFKSLLMLAGGFASAIAGVVFLLELATKQTNVLGVLVGSLVFVVKAFAGVFKGFQKAFAEISNPLKAYYDDFIATVQRMGKAGDDFGQKLGYGLAQALIYPLNFIYQAWQGLVDWFARLPLVSHALNIGQGLVNALNHGAADVTADAWESTEQRVGGVFGSLASAASGIGNTIAGAFKPRPQKNKVLQPQSQVEENPESLGNGIIKNATLAITFLRDKITALIKSIGLLNTKVDYQSQLLKHQLRLQQVNLVRSSWGILTNRERNSNLSGRASNLPWVQRRQAQVRGIGGLKEAAANPRLMRLKQLGGLVGELTGLKGGAIASLLTGITSVSGALGLLVLAFSTDFLEIRTKTVKLAQSMQGTFKGAIDWITGAWTGFSNWFGKMPLVRQALAIAQGLINALNHFPTIRIPEAWEEAGRRIVGQFHYWLNIAKWVGVAIAGTLITALTAIAAATNPVMAAITGFTLGISALAFFSSKILAGLGAVLDWFGNRILALDVKFSGVNIGAIAGPLFGLSTIFAVVTTAGTLMAAVLTAPVFAPWIAGATALGGSIAGVLFLWQRFRKQTEIPPSIEQPTPTPGFKERVGQKAQGVRDAIVEQGVRAKNAGIGAANTVVEQATKVKDAGVGAANTVAQQYQLFASAAADVSSIRQSLQAGSSLVDLNSNYLSKIVDLIQNLVDFNKPKPSPEPPPVVTGQSLIVGSGEVNKPNAIENKVGGIGAAIQNTVLGQNAFGKLLLSPIARAPLDAMGLNDTQKRITKERERERIRQSLGQQKTGVQSSLPGPLGLFSKKDEFQEAIQSKLQGQELNLAEKVISGAQSSSALVREQYKGLVTTITQNGQEQVVLNEKGQNYLEGQLAGLIKQQTGSFSEKELAVTAQQTGFKGTPEQLRQAALEGLRGKDKDQLSALEQAAGTLPGMKIDYQELASGSLSRLVEIAQNIFTCVDYISALLQPKSKVPKSLASGASIPVDFQSSPPSPPSPPAEPSLVSKAGDAIKNTLSSLGIHGKTPLSTGATGAESLTEVLTRLRDSLSTEPVEYTSIQKRIGQWFAGKFEQPKGVQARLSDQVGKPQPTAQGVDADPSKALAFAAQNTTQAWNNTTTAIASNIDALVSTSADQGYELQKAVSEGSPGPTYWIREHWSKTVEAIKGWMHGLSATSQKVGEAVTQSLTPQEMVQKAKEGIQQVGKSLLILGGDIGDFIRRATVATLTLNFFELGDAVGDFGGNFGYFAQGVMTGFGQMGKSAIAFWLMAMSWATPFFVILGGVTFVTAVLVANFLGLRTILGGVIRIGIGAGQILIAVLGGLGNTVKSLGKIALGVFKALGGDFSLLDEGIAQLKASFTQMKEGVVRGLKTIGRGIRQIFTGIDQGIQQVFPSFKGVIHYVQAISSALKNPETAARMLAQGIIRVARQIGDTIQAIPGFVARGVQKAFNSVKDGVNAVLKKGQQVVAYFSGLSFSEVGNRFVTVLRDVGNAIVRLPGTLTGAVERMIPALKAPFNYLRRFVGTFINEMKASLPPGITASIVLGFERAAGWIKKIFSRIKSGLRGFITQLGFEEQFNAVTQGIRTRWQQLVDFATKTNLFGSMPKDIKQFSAAFVRGVDLAQAIWTRFTNWLASTTLFPKIWTQLETLGSRFTQFVEKLGEKWEGVKGEFATGNMFSGFFERMRRLGTRFQEFVIKLEEKWRGFARIIPGIPIFQSLFTELYVFGDRFSSFANFLEQQWRKLAQFLGTTSLVGGAISTIEFLGRKFTEVIGFVKGAWEPFTEFLNSSDFFSKAFEQLRKFGNFIPQLGETTRQEFSKAREFIENVFQDVPGAVNRAVERISNAWRGFTDQFQSILSPIVDFAKKVAQWLIDALNHSPTIRIPEAWEKAVAWIRGTIESLVAPAQGVAEKLTGIFQSTTNRISEYWTGFSQTFETRVVPALNALKPHLDELRAGFQEFAERLQTALSPLIQRFGQITSQVQDFIQRIRAAREPIDATATSAVNLGDLLARGLAGAISTIERMSPAISVVLKILGNLTISFLELSDRILAGLSPALSTIQELADKVGRFGNAFTEVFGAAVAPAAKELLPVLKKLLAIYGRVATVSAALPFGMIAGGLAGVVVSVKALLNLFEPMNQRTKELLTSFSSAQDMGKAFGEVVGNSISGVINTLKILLEVAATVGDTLTAPLKFIDAAWEKTGNAIGGVLGRLKRQAKGAGKGFQGDLSEASPGPTYWIRQNWAKTGDFVSNQIKEMASTAKTQGNGMRQSLENVMGGGDASTNIFRFAQQNGNKAQLVSIYEQMEAMRRAGALEQQIREKHQAGLLSDARAEKQIMKQRQLGQKAHLAMINTVREIQTSAREREASAAGATQERNQKLANSSRGLFLSMGSALSNFAPQLATPLFMLNDFVDLFIDLKDVLPQVRALFGATEAATAANAATTSAANGVIAASEGTVTVAAASSAAAQVQSAAVSSGAATGEAAIVGGANGVIAASEGVVAAAAASSAAAQVQGAAASSGAATGEAAVVGGANSFMATTYGLLGRAAQSAYANMIKPLIPLLPWIVGVSAALFILYQGFKNNFLGIGEAIKGVGGFIKEFFDLLLGGVWQTIASIFLNIEVQISAIGRTLGRVGHILMEPFRPLLAAFGVSGQRSLLGNAMVVTVNLILLPLKLVAGAINLIIRLLSGFIQGVILVGGIILNFILLPIRLINAAIYGVMMGFNSVMLGVNQAVNLLLLAPLNIATAVAYKIASVIAKIGRVITAFILSPFFAVQNAIMRAISPVVDFVFKAIGLIAGAAALIFTILNPGMVIGTFLAFVTGATLAAKAIRFTLGIPLKAIGFLWRNTLGKMAAAAVADSTVVGGANTFMATTYGLLANAARWAYKQILMPLMPLLPLILGVVAVLGLLYLGFKTNFLGIGDVIKGFVGGFLLVFDIVWGVIKGIGDAIAQVFGTLISSVGEIFGAFKELAGAILTPFDALFGLFGGNGAGGEGSLGEAISATVGFILIPIKFVADALSLVIRGITSLIVGVIRLGTAIINSIFRPITSTLGFLSPVMGVIRTIIGAIGGVALGIAALIGLIGFLATTLIPLIMTGTAMLFGMIVSGMTFLISATLPALISGLLTVATVVIPLLISAFLFVSTVAIPAIISGLTAIATTAIPLVMTGLSAAIPFIVAGFGFIAATVIPAIVAGVMFIATVAIPAMIAGIAGLVTAAIPLLITFSPIILMVLAVVAAVVLIKLAFDAVVGAIQKVIQGMASAISSVGQFFQALPLIGGLFGGQKNNAGDGSNIQEFAGGGLVLGQAAQAVPVIAHAGEFVMTESATQANLGILQYLNAGGKLALPAPNVGVMPPMPLRLPTPAAAPAQGAGSGTVVIENVNINFEVQINANNGVEAGDEFLRYIEDPRFKKAVRQVLRESVERMK